ncbi:MAG: FAD-binding oxidoreductase [Alphaproteobacteria bacterium]|nr:FAD-binding oxidoreductase [Alphaproteobacteria bacterium]
MLDDPRSHGLYEISAPPAPETAPLAGKATADVVIVGGGYTGLSSALHLAEAGKSAIVLEAHEIGFGASGRNSGLVNAGLWMKPEDLLATLGETHGNRVLELLGQGPAEVFRLIDRHAIACEAVRKGTLHCGYGEAGRREVAERHRQWAARGAPVHLLSGEEAARRIGSSAYAGALLDLRAGTLQPLAYARGLAKAAISAGARIHTGSPVDSAHYENGAWIVPTARGEVSAPWLIVATDAYTRLFWPAIRREQVHLPYFNLSTRPLSADLLKSILPGGEGCWDTRTVLSSFRIDAAGRLIFGSAGALRGSGTPIHRAWAHRALKRIFPQLGQVEFETEWYGMIGMTGDHLPRLHRFGTRAIGFCGYNGRGISPGTVFGRMLAEHILGKRTEAEMPLPVTEFERAPFQGLREAYYEYGAQIAHVAGARF